MEDCDHADGAPAACLVAGRAELEALSEGQHRIGESTSWVEQPPGNGPDFVEATESVDGMFAMNASNRGKKAKVRVDFFG